MLDKEYITLDREHYLSDYLLGNNDTNSIVEKSKKQIPSERLETL